MKYKGLKIRKTGKLFRVQGLKKSYATLAAAKKAVDRWEKLQMKRDRRQ